MTETPRVTEHHRRRALDALTFRYYPEAGTYAVVYRASGVIVEGGLPTGLRAQLALQDHAADYALLLAWDDAHRTATGEEAGR